MSWEASRKQLPDFGRYVDPYLALELSQGELMNGASIAQLMSLENAHGPACSPEHRVRLIGNSFVLASGNVFHSLEKRCRQDGAPRLTEGRTGSTALLLLLYNICLREQL